MTTPNLTGNALKLRNKLQTNVGRAISDFNMIEDGDTLLLCLSGGKDSYTMLSMLMALQQRAPIDFKLIAMNLDQKQPGFPAHILPDYLAALGVDFRIVEADTYSIVKEKIPEGKTTCSLCSRLRRGVIYRVAKELGAQKIVLGHHRDDIVETLFLNMFFGAKLKAMPPKFATNDGAHIVIRPLAYCAEKDIAKFAQHMQYPIIPCDLCGSQQNLQRQHIKNMLSSWEKEFPGRIEKIFRAITNVAPSHLADTELFDFKGLSSMQTTDEDLLFDEDVELQHTPVALTLSEKNGDRIQFLRQTS